MTSLGPRSYEILAGCGGCLDRAWPYLAQDAGLLLMLALSFRLLNWLEAAALAVGVVLVLAYPFLTLINLVCVVVILALAAIDDPASLRRFRLALIAAFVLVAPPMIITDEAGRSIGLLWFAIVTAVVLASIHFAHSAAARTRGELQDALPVLGILAVVLLVLLASARGVLVLNSGWPGGADLTPQVRDIWQAVSKRVPRDALVFTDQTGRDRGFLTGWNTYVLHGRRQVFMASWFQSPKLQTDPVERDARLRLNDAVLSGQLDPAQAPTSRKYDAFFAVVSISRRLPPGWHPVYSNADYALYRWGP